MEHSQPTTIEGLPDNARRPLEPGETYAPVVPDETGVYEVTTRSVTMGLFFCALFSMAAAYLALRVGQGWWQEPHARPAWVASRGKRVNPSRLHDWSDLHGRCYQEREKTSWRAPPA